VVIDGAVTPEKIPDTLAYQHFIRAMVAPDEPSLNRAKRREGLLSRVQLSARDRAAMVTALSGVESRLSAVVETRRRAARGPALTPDAVRALRDEEDGLVRDARALIKSRLTSQGAARLEAHIQEHVKRRIKIYGAVNQ
jgi:hypothetical protein